MSNEHRFDENEQREWEAQENARASTSDDALTRRYRKVARALETMPLPSLRADFAARVARRAEAEQNALAPFERFALIALAVAFAAAIVVLAVAMNVPLGDFVREVREANGTRWVVALVLCVAVTCFPLSRLRERAR